MKSGCIIINGTDIYSAFGVFATRGAYAPLIGWPSLKEVESNDWQEANGVEPDLSALPLAPRTFNLTFACSGENADYAGFCAFLEQERDLAVDAAEIGLTFALRASAYPSLAYYDLPGASGEFRLFSVQFTEDTPTDHGYTSAVGGIATDNTWAVDGTPFTWYNTRVLNGTVATILRRPAPKAYLTRTTRYTSGQTYDQNPALWDGSAFVSAETHGATFRGARDIVLSCLCTGKSAAQTWQNYYALLHKLTMLGSGSDVTLRGAHTISSSLAGFSAPCYYKSQNVTAFYPDTGHYWIEFKINLCNFGGTI